MHAKRPANAAHGRKRAEQGRNMPTMQVTTVTVVGGKVVVEGAALAEGAVVAVLSTLPDEAFALTVQEEDELLAAMAEIERGEFVSAQELLESLSKHG
jgi:hypothetical protein